MLLLEPFWVYSSVAMCVACGRKELLKVTDIWGNRYFSSILIMIAGVFVPVENWVLHRHPDWETTFLVKTVSDSTLIALASLLHILIALSGYWLSMHLLRNYGEDAVIKSTMWAFSIFFCVQGLFHDSFMYSGTYEEYHDGVEKSFLSFFATDRFFDAYIVFFLLYGPPFYYLIVSWNAGYPREERNNFNWKMGREVVLHAAFITGVYVIVWGVGLLPPKFDLSRLLPMYLIHFTSHLLVVLPLYLSPTKERSD